MFFYEIRLTRIILNNNLMIVLDGKYGLTLLFVIGDILYI